MALPKVLLSISEPQVTAAKNETESKNFIRYGEPERPYVSPYSDPAHHQHQSQSLNEEEPISVTIKITPSSAVKMDKSPTPSQPRKHRGPHPTAGPPAKKIKQESFYVDVDRFMESESSPIYKDVTNLKLVLNHPLAQSALERSGLANQVQAADCDEFATAAAAFKHDGRGGKHDPEWVRQAQEAAKTRQAGGFQGYEDDMFEEHWACESRELSEDEDEKKGRKGKPEGCNENTYTKFGDDEYKDDGGAGVFKGNMFGNGRTQRTSGNGFNYGHDKTTYGGGSNYTNDSKQGKNHKHVVDSALSTSDTFPMYESFIDRSIKLPDGVADWEGRGYCDNPHSIYPDPELLV